jgi:hypothetical protein
MKNMCRFALENRRIDKGRSSSIGVFSVESTVI